ncbi:MAG TPA: carboxypeptidase-like regulatory domain-containing protein, partial [Planctomycetota bacterium]|nr:carboxypeptidase-like regulatory domain-containing protein [Planctomycetota bacterium]
MLYKFSPSLSRRSGAVSIALAVILALAVCGVLVWFFLSEPAAPPAPHQGTPASEQDPSRQAMGESEPVALNRAASGREKSDADSPSVTTVGESAQPGTSEAEGPRRTHTRIRGKVLGIDEKPVAGARVVWLDDSEAEIDEYKHDPSILLLDAPPALVPDDAPAAGRTRHAKTESAADGTYEVELPSGTRDGALVAFHPDEGFAFVNVAEAAPPTLSELDTMASRVKAINEQLHGLDEDIDRVIFEREPEEATDVGERSSISPEVAPEIGEPPPQTPGTSADSSSSSSLERTIDLQLGLRSRISGRVVEKGTKIPAAGMFVEAVKRDASSFPAIGWVELDDVPRALVGEDGSYAFYDLPPADYRLAPRTGRGEWISISRSRAERVPVENGVVVDGVDFEVERGGTIFASVTGPDRRPVNKVEMNVLPENMVDLATQGEFDIFLAADGTSKVAEGVHRVGGLPLDQTYHVQIHADGLSPSTQEVKLTRDAPEVEIEVRLEKAFAIRGRIEYADGRPAPQIPVWARRIDAETSGNPFLPVQGTANGRSESDGTFEVSGVSPGKWRVSTGVELGFLAGDDASAPQVDVEVSAGDVDGVILRLSESSTAGSSTIAGRVVDDAGQPVSGATVNSALVGSNPMAAFFRTGQGGGVTSDENGDFVIEHLKEGSYRLSASLKSRTMELEEPVAAGAEDVVLVLPRDAVIEGRVVNGQGAPLTAGEVSWREIDDDAAAAFLSPMQTSGPTAAIDGEGRFTITGPAGEIEILARVPGHALGRSAPLRLAPGELRDDVEIVVTRGATIFGRVAAPGLPKIAGANVSLRPSSGNASTEAMESLLANMLGGTVERATTDAEGGFFFENVPPGRFVLRAAHDEWAPSDEKALSIEIDEERDVGTLLLRAPSRI